MKQQVIFLTVAQGKQLIARGVAALPQIERSAREGTLLIVAGTTNEEVAKEILGRLGLEKKLEHFYRGVTVPAGKTVAPPTAEDIVIQQGALVEGKTIFDVAPDMKAGDMILKGGNALNMEEGQAAVLVGNPKMGTTLPIQEAVYGRRVEVMIPIGLEKRVSEPIRVLTEVSLEPDTTGVRLAPLPGKVYTELHALKTLYEIEARLLASGGIEGAEGGVYLLCRGDEKNMDRLKNDLKKI